jgi:hypothetical protein
MEAGIYALYIPGRIFVGKYAEEDGRKVLNDVAEIRTVTLNREIQEQALLLGKLYAPPDAVWVKLGNESFMAKVYIQLTSGLKLV